MLRALIHGEAFSWNEYKNWPETERWELIDGHPYSMAAAPSVRHQSVAQELFMQLKLHFKNTKCQPFFSPTDVKFSDYDIVQPDLFVVCDEKQITEDYIDGAPALIIEIISKSNTKHDRCHKMKLYAKYNVKEYWLITPWSPLVEVFSLERGKYVLDNVYEEGDVIQSVQFPDLKIKFEDIFIFPVPLKEGPKDYFELREPPVHYGTVKGDESE